MTLRRRLPLILALLVVAVAVAVAVAARAGSSADEPRPVRGGTVAVFPAPGTKTALPGTKFAFRGRPAGQLGEVTVRGSDSGKHSGEWKAHSDGKGASFVTEEDFEPGETVTVTTDMPVEGEPDGQFTVTVGREHQATFGGGGEIVEPGKQHAFRSRPDLSPPLVTVDPDRRSGSDGYIVIGPKPSSDNAQSGPMLVDDDGQPVYFAPVADGHNAYDVRVQRHRGKPVLTWWEGKSAAGHGLGSLRVVDETYETVALIESGNGLQFDQHEFLITPEDTALTISYPEFEWDLRPYGGQRDGIVVDSIIQEIDLATGLVIFEWHSVGTVPFEQSNDPPDQRRWDYVHANSVERDRDGNFLVSARRTSAVYKIDGRTAQVLWTMGGKGNEFEREEGTEFWLQHDARRHDDGTISIFDNGGEPFAKRSRALKLDVDEQRKTVALAREVDHPDGFFGATQGNAQFLPNGHVVVGWGSRRFFSEFDEDGRLVWNGRVSLAYDTYRAYRAKWEGRPATRPAVAAVRAGGGGAEVFVSWNGSTETVAWEVLAGDDPDRLEPVRTVDREGFETAIALRDAPAHVAVRAKDAGGGTLATSPTVRVE